MSMDVNFQALFHFFHTPIPNEKSQIPANGGGISGSLISF